MSFAKSLGIKDWYAGLKESEVLAPKRTSYAEAAGIAARGALVGGLAGSAVGVADSLLPGGLSAGQVGLAAAAAYAGAVALHASPVGKMLADANIGLTAIAAREWTGNKTAHHAGTTSSVLKNKAAAIAAHGDFGSDMGLNAGEDPLIAAGAHIFGS